MSRIPLIKPENCESPGDKGIVQLVHLVSGFAAYNRLNTALQTDYDYRDMWRAVAFNWTLKEGDNTRGVR